MSWKNSPGMSIPEAECILGLFGLLNTDMTKTLLILAANPKDSDRFHFDREIREITGAWEQSRDRVQFKIEQELALTWERLRRALVNYKPEIIHFVGHGHGKPGLVIEAEDGTIQEISGDRLLKLLQCFSVKCIVLNACHSRVQAETIHQHVPCVIGMKQKIAQESSQEFAIPFYEGIFGGMSYEQAFQLGKTEISSTFDDFKPYLLFRDKKILEQETRSESNQQRQTTEDNKDSDWLNQTIAEIDSSITIKNKPASEATEFRQITNRWEEDLYQLDHDQAKKGTSKIFKKIKRNKSDTSLFLFQGYEKFLGKRYIKYLEKSIASERIGRFSKPYKVGFLDNVPTETEFLMNLGEHLAIEISSSQQISMDQIFEKIKIGLKGCNVFFLEVNLPDLDGDNSFLCWFLEKFWGKLLQRMPEFRSQNSSAVFIAVVTLESEVNEVFLDEFTCKLTKPYSDKFIALPNVKWKEDEIREWIECYSNLQLLPGQLEKIPRSIFRFTNGLPGASEAKLLQELENLAS